MAVIAVGLGSNRGDRSAMLKRALDELGQCLECIAVSPVYETQPMYVENQPDFLNAAALFRSGLGPLAILRLLKKVEGLLGRTPAERYGPRELDLDLLAYGPLQYRFERFGKTVLEVPHARTPERRFVLQPLFDVAPDLILPGLGAVSTLLAATGSQAETVRVHGDAVLSLSGA